MFLLSQLTKMSVILRTENRRPTSKLVGSGSCAALPTRGSLMVEQAAIIACITRQSNGVVAGLFYRFILPVCLFYQE